MVIYKNQSKPLMGVWIGYDIGTTSTGNNETLLDAHVDSNSNDDGDVINPNIEAFRQVVQEPSILPNGLDFQYEIRRYRLYQYRIC